MTDKEAISLASAYVAREQLPVESELVAVRHMRAERFNRLYGYKKYEYDFLVVEFKKLLAPDVLVENPGSVLVVVEEVTERAYQDHHGLV